MRRSSNKSWGTVSKALEKSIARDTVRRGGLPLIKARGYGVGNRK